MAIVDQQATLRDTSTRISSMMIALCLQSVAVVVTDCSHIAITMQLILVEVSV